MRGVHTGVKDLRVAEAGGDEACLFEHAAKRHERGRVRTGSSSTSPPEGEQRSQARTESASCTGVHVNWHSEGMLLVCRLNIVNAFGRARAEGRRGRGAEAGGQLAVRHPCSRAGLGVPSGESATETSIRRDDGTTMVKENRERRGKSV